MLRIAALMTYNQNADRLQFYAIDDALRNVHRGKTDGHRRLVCRCQGNFPGVSQLVRIRSKSAVLDDTARTRSMLVIADSELIPTLPASPI